MPAGLHDSGADGGRIIVGRAEILEDLRAALRDVRRGHVRTVLLNGPTGSGKTATLETFLEHCRSSIRGLRVLSARCDEWEAQFPLAGYAQLMQTEPARAITGRLQERPPPDEGEAPLDPRRTANYADSLVAHLNALQAHGSVVVAVDDAHHLDQESMRVLAFAMRRMQTKRVLFVLTLDPDLAWTVPKSILDQLTGHRALQLRAGPLGPEDVRELARRRFDVELPMHAALRLVEHTDGLAQQIVELLGELPPETWQNWFTSLPASARLAARARGALETAPPDLRAVAEAVAVLGSAAGLAELTAVSGVRSLMDALDEGHRAGLLRLSVDQTHSLVTFVETGADAAVYERILPSRLLTLHRRAAEAVAGEADALDHRVAATPGADEELAGELEDFARWQAAGGAWRDVATALLSASRLSAERGLRDDRLLRAVDALIGSGDIPRAQMWTGVVDAVPPGPQRSSVLAYLHAVSGNNRGAQAQLELAWDSLDRDRDRDPALVAQVAQRFVLHGLASWDGPVMTGWAETAMSLTDGDAPAHVESEAIYGLGLYAQGRVPEAVAAYDRAFERIGENAQKQRIQMGGAWLDLRMDRVESALVNFEAAVPTEHRGGSLRISLWAEAWLARAQLTIGNWDAAAATVSRASARLESSRMPLIGPLLYWTAAELWSMRGDWDRARDYVSQAAVHPGAYRTMQVPAHLARARFHESRADYESALESLEPLTVVDPWTDGRISFWTWQDTYVNALVMTNRLEQAETFLTDFENVRREIYVPADRARLAWARGRLVAAQGDPDTAREHFEVALDHLRDRHRPYLRARISFAFGQSMRRAGKRRLASSVLQTARELYDGLGAVTYVERCDRELRATGMESGYGTAPADAAPAPAAADPLTVQERTVADLVAGGATNKEAARTLFLAEKTVQYHLTRIYRKLGIRSRSELAARYHRAD